MVWLSKADLRGVLKGKKPYSSEPERGHSFQLATNEGSSEGGGGAIAAGAVAAAAVVDEEVDDEEEEEEEEDEEEEKEDEADAIVSRPKSIQRGKIAGPCATKGLSLDLCAVHTVERVVVVRLLFVDRPECEKNARVAMHCGC